MQILYILKLSFYDIKGEGLSWPRLEIFRKSDGLQSVLQAQLQYLL